MISPKEVRAVAIQKIVNVAREDNSILKVDWLWSVQWIARALICAPFVVKTTVTNSYVAGRGDTIINKPAIIDK